MPLVLHQPMHMVRQQPARKLQQLATAVPTNAGGSAHNTVPRRSNDSHAHSSPKPNHYCTHSPRVSPHQLVQLARAQFRPTAATPNENEQLTKYKNCAIIAAHNAFQVVRVRVTTVPSFLNQNSLMYGVIRRQDTDKTGLTIGCKTAMVSNRTAITLQCVSGQASAEFTLPPLPLTAPPPLIPVGLPSELLERRPDIAAAERIMAYANAQIGVAEAA